jgi:hypothetical protein
MSALVNIHHLIVGGGRRGGFQIKLPATSTTHAEGPAGKKAFFAELLILKLNRINLDTLL